MKERHLTRTLFTLALSLLLITLFAAPAKAVKRWRESRGGGWNIWIAATDFDRRGDDDAIKRGNETQGLGLANIPEPVLGGDVLIALKDRGFAEYVFESPRGGTGYIYARVTTVGKGRGRWVVALNSEIALDGMGINTHGFWEWRTGGPAAQKKLQKGMNTIRVMPLTAWKNVAPAMDIFVVSSQELQPKDAHYKAAKRVALSVAPTGNLATTWARLKN